MNWAASIWGRLAAANHNSGPEDISMTSISKLPFPGQPVAGTVHWFDTQVSASGARGVHSELITCTPGLAAAILARNPDNRNIKPAKAEQYANDMRGGRWTFNGEPILISTDGLLNDGQHRLTALMDANVCLPMLFVFGLDRDTRFTVDQGAARTASDFLSMGGVANASSASTIARILIAYEASGGTSIDTRVITNAEVLDRVHRDLRIGEAAHYGVTHGRKSNAYVAATIVGFCYYLFSDIDADDAHAFLDGLCSGANLKDGAPALTCREKLLTMTKARQPKVAVIFRAWNMHRRGVKKVKTNGLISTLPLPALI